MDVIAPLIVAALGSGNDVVFVINAVSDHATCLPKGHADLADQLRRAAQSVPQNIAEGCGRTTRADKAKHYTIARGSAMECASHFDVMHVDELIDAELYARGNDLLERIVAMLTKLIDP